uniref:Uncharacterized protein n=1 Tax=Anguilla anguilla TaxID=7936 RepID=A0A0E9TWP5_ANGAN
MVRYESPVLLTDRQQPLTPEREGQVELVSALLQL